MPRRSARPTVATIARDLGISAATVSYALNDKPGVSAAVRERVVTHAREVGWTPHSGAQALRRGRSGNIGLVMIRDPQELSREPFYAAVTAGIESATSSGEFELLVRFVGGGVEDEIEVFRTWAHRRRVDGVVLLDMAEGDPRPAELESLGMPFAVIGHYRGPESFVNVVTAEPDDARTVLDHLLECGYDGCIHLGGPLDYGHEARRIEMMRELCREQGIPHAHTTGTYTIDAGTAAFERIRRDISERPAIVASSDLIAIGALRAARSRQLAVPEELGIVSWDDSLIAEVASPALTALSRRPFEMGQHAGGLLVGRVEGEVAAGTVHRSDPATLVRRDSTALP